MINTLHEKQIKSALNNQCWHITDVRAPNINVGKNDFYSEGDYWWPNAEKECGLPYVRIDGQSNPNSFYEHRLILRKMRTDLSILASAFHKYSIDACAQKACRILQEFFVNEATRMNPSLKYAQAIPGICDGRGIGIIDTIHLIDVPFAIAALRASDYMNDSLYTSLQTWFDTYTKWLMFSSNGIAERNEPNNHSVAYYAQIAAFAYITKDKTMLELCAKQFKILLSQQMSADGSFLLELERTKPYGYSIFTLDIFVTLCMLCSTNQDNLWLYETNGKSIHTGLSFLMPYLIQRNMWPYKKDVEYFTDWPVRLPSLLFAYLSYGDNEFLETYKRLPELSDIDEVRRNIAVRSPYLLIVEINKLTRKMRSKFLDYL